VEDRLLNLKQTARLLGLSVATTRCFVHSGDLRPSTDSGPTLVHLDDIDEFVASRRIVPRKRASSGIADA
jgi:predicted site-specific integrase-resolvase